MKIKVIGIGGAGGNILTRLPRPYPKPVELIAINSDLQDLKATKADKKIQIGKKRTLGLGSGMNPKIGREAAEESKEEIKNVITGGDIVFIICGLGGGTGSGASPVVANIAKETGALTIGIVTFPFYFEGAQRKKIAHRALSILEKNLDTFIVVFNDKVLDKVQNATNISSAFYLIDETIHNIIFDVLNLIVTPGLINIDLADLSSIMKNAGRAFFGIGKGQGEKKIEQATKEALTSPFLETSIDGAKGILFNIAGGKNLTLFDVQKTANIINQKGSPQAKIIFGAFQNNKQFQPDEVRITLIATGI
ncbi:cell division protein FtsZ [bacterium]|nr:cell division protein FtsZ [bacterium]